MSFRVVLAGAGEQATETLGPALRALAPTGVELVALASPTAARRERARAVLGGGLRGYGALEQAIAAERPDGVVVAAPDALHEELAVRSLRAGCHVLCEKPMALSVDGARRMAREAEAAGRVLAIGYQYPFVYPAWDAWVARDLFHGVHRIDASWVRRDGIPDRPAFWDRPDGGPGADLLGHLLSVGLAGVDAAPRWASAVAWRRQGGRRFGARFAGHDTLEALIGFAGGEAMHTLVSWSLPIEASEAISVTFQAAAHSLELPLPGVTVPASRARLVPGGGLPASDSRADAVEAATERLIANWVATACGHERLRTPTETALAIQAIQDAVLASASAGGLRTATAQPVRARP